MLATDAAALTVPAPATEKLAALRLMLATPLASVRAVPVAGVNVARLVSVVNVTTTPTKGVVPFLMVALTLAGLPNAIEVRAVVVVRSVSVIVMVGVLEDITPSLETAPLPQPASPALTAIITVSARNTEVKRLKPPDILCIDETICFCLRHAKGLRISRRMISADLGVVLVARATVLRIQPLTYTTTA